MFLVGPPGAAKTGIAAQIALHMAHTCAVGMLWDDEGDAPAVVRIGQALGLDRDRLEGQDPETIEELRRLLAELHLKSAPLDQGDTSIKKLCEETDATFPKDLRRVYVIDSIQSARLGLDEDDLDDRQKANAATDYLKREMRRQDSIAIVTSQANRRSYASGRPGENSSPLSSAMNSAGIEYAGHVVIVLSGDTDKTLTLNVVKNRLGSKGSASFTWDARRAAVREVDEETLERSADEADQIALAGKIKKAEDVLRRRPGLTSALWRKGSKLDGPDFCVVREELERAERVTWKRGLGTLRRIKRARYAGIRVRVEDLEAFRQRERTAARLLRFEAETGRGLFVRGDAKVKGRALFLHGDCSFCWRVTLSTWGARLRKSRVARENLSKSDTHSAQCLRASREGRALTPPPEEGSYRPHPVAYGDVGSSHVGPAFQLFALRGTCTPAARIAR